MGLFPHPSIYHSGFDMCPVRSDEGQHDDTHLKDQHSALPPFSFFPGLFWVKWVECEGNTPHHHQLHEVAPKSGPCAHEYESSVKESVETGLHFFLMGRSVEINITFI